MTESGYEKHQKLSTNLRNLVDQYMDILLQVYGKDHDRVKVADFKAHYIAQICGAPDGLKKLTDAYPSGRVIKSKELKVLFTPYDPAQVSVDEKRTSVTNPEAVDISNAVGGTRGLRPHWDVNEEILRAKESLTIRPSPSDENKGAEEILNSGGLDPIHEKISSHEVQKRLNERRGNQTKKPKAGSGKDDERGGKGR